MRLFTGSKRGIMGIGTLIIFIATILVAAVAAAVLISTSNVLQQKSLLVGQEAKKSITNGVDVFSVIADADSESESFNNFEILVRLSPGSDPLQMRRFDIEFLSNKLHTAANLYYPEEETENAVSPDAELTQDTNRSFDLDLDDDGITDEIILDHDLSNWSLRVNLSDMGISDRINLSQNVTTGTTINLEESPIKIGESMYGSIEIIDGVVSATPGIPVDAVTIRKVASECRFDLLPPENYYCYVPVIGNDDYILDSREKFKLLYKLRDRNAVGIGEELLFILSSEKGRLTEIRARAPDVVTFTSTRIWPLG